MIVADILFDEVLDALVTGNFAGEEDCHVSLNNLSRATGCGTIYPTKGPSGKSSTAIVGGLWQFPQFCGQEHGY